MSESKKGILTYKGHPLVRSGNMLYYGDLSAPCVVMLSILTKKTVGKMEIADKVQVQLMSTDPELSMTDRILKKSEKKGLYNAMDIGAIWLERSLTE
jgi:Ni,Fe-hydrogenase III large subunit